MKVKVRRKSLAVVEAEEELADPIKTMTMLRPPILPLYNDCRCLGPTMLRQQLFLLARHTPILQYCSCVRRDKKFMELENWGNASLDQIIDLCYGYVIAENRSLSKTTKLWLKS
jgi:hypothetical protein